MRHELVRQLTHAGPDVPVSVPGRGLLRRAGALASLALHLAALVALLAALPVAVAVAVTALLVDPLAGWVAVVVTVAAAPSLARRLLAARPTRA